MKMQIQHQPTQSASVPGKLDESYSMPGYWIDLPTFRKLARAAVLWYQAKVDQNAPDFHEKDWFIQLKHAYKSDGKLIVQVVGQPLTEKEA
jgi:hypothetical protein